MSYAEAVEDIEDDESNQNEYGVETEEKLFAEDDATASVIRDLAFMNLNLNAEDLGEIDEIKPVKILTPKYETTRIPNPLLIITWNIEMGKRKLGERTKTIVDFLEKAKHDIILLQEENKCGYFTATLLRKETVKYESHKIIFFRNTSQGRSILFTSANVGGAKIDIINVHLESLGGKEHSQRRTTQFKKCLQVASSTPSDRTVIFGGDMNIRDWEAKRVPLPKKMCDLWEQMGSSASTQWTWNPRENKNLELRFSPPPKRCDRVYYRSSIQETFTPQYFGLTGKDKLAGSELFPSEHWAVVCKFSLSPRLQNQQHSSNESNSSNVEPQNEEDSDVTCCSRDNFVVPEKGEPQNHEASRMPNPLSVITWNIDMRSTKIDERAKAVVDLLEKEKHDIILLQEVTALGFNYICSRLGETYVILKQKNCPYFTVTLLKNGTVKYESHKNIDFRNSSQGRSILFTSAKVGFTDFDIINVHLESAIISKEICQKRKAQFQKCLDMVSSTPSDRIVIFGGDMNNSDLEAEVVPLPPTICDVWVHMGSAISTKWTCNPPVNKNLEYKVGPFPPKRFDRVYFRPSTPELFTPEYFGLAGKDKLAGSDFFPSDHWAIECKFSVSPSVQNLACTSSDSNSINKPVMSEEEDFDNSRDNYAVKENWFDDD